jgi:hypothetical protein
MNEKNIIFKQSLRSCLNLIIAIYSTMFSNSNLEIYQVFPFKNRQKPALISMELMYKIFLKSNLDSFLETLKTANLLWFENRYQV